MIDTYAVETTELLVVKYKIHNVIEAVKDDTLKLLLCLRYENFLTWEQVAVEMEISFQWVHVLHSRALKIIEPLIVIDTLDMI